MHVLQEPDDDPYSLTFGAGEVGAFRACGLTTSVLGSWGKPRAEAEPLSQAIAAVERDMTRIAAIETYCEQLDHPAAVRHAAQAARDYEVCLDYWSDLYGSDAESAYSRARTADEYIALLEPLPETARGQRIDFAALKERIDIVDFIGRYTKLRHSGGKWYGRCALPGHDDSSPSLVVYPESRSWYCYGCHQGGDVIDFAHLRDGTTARALAGAA